MFLLFVCLFAHFLFTSAAMDAPIRLMPDSNDWKQRLEVLKNYEFAEISPPENYKIIFWANLVADHGDAEKCAEHNLFSRDENGAKQLATSAIDASEAIKSCFEHFYAVQIGSNANFYFMLKKGSLQRKMKAIAKYCGSGAAEEDIKGQVHIVPLDSKGNAIPASDDANAAEIKAAAVQRAIPLEPKKPLHAQICGNGNGSPTIECVVPYHPEQEAALADMLHRWLNTESSLSRFSKSLSNADAFFLRAYFHQSMSSALSSEHNSEEKERLRALFLRHFNQALASGTLVQRVRAVDCMVELVRIECGRVKRLGHVGKDTNSAVAESSDQQASSLKQWAQFCSGWEGAVFNLVNGVRVLYAFQRWLGASQKSKEIAEKIVQLNLRMLAKQIGQGIRLSGEEMELFEKIGKMAAESKALKAKMAQIGITEAIAEICANLEEWAKQHHKRGIQLAKQWKEVCNRMEV